MTMLKLVVFICLVLMINGYPSSTDQNKDCSNYCQNGGICVLNNNNRQCYCLPEWEGKWCENLREFQTFQIDSFEESEISSARVHACSLVPPNLCNGGLCQFTNNQYSCACPSHLFGQRCELPSPCNDYCYNDGICSVEGNNPSCNCTEQFDGIRCHIRVTISPQKTTSTTPATTNSYCAAYQQFCGVGKCVNDNTGAPSCQCPPTHTGQFCENPIGVTQTPSTANPVNPVNPGTVSSVYPGTVNPVVTNPQSGNGNACASNPCLNNRPCYNHGNTFICYCGNSFTGSRCETING